MKHSPVPSMVTASALLLWVAASQPRAAELISPAPEFQLKMTGTLVPVSAQEYQCVLPGSIDRKTLEFSCAALRAASRTTGTPVFDEGYDSPNTSRTVHVLDARGSAELTTFNFYGCELPRGERLTDACSCHYKVNPFHFIAVRKAVGGTIEFSTTRLNEGPMGTTRRHRAGDAPDVEAALRRYWVTGGVDCGILKTTTDGIVDSGVFDLPQGVRLIDMGAIRRRAR